MDEALKELVEMAQQAAQEKSEQPPVEEIDHGCGCG